jgi:drug/metabolite transporter (DMT)-like permease
MDGAILITAKPVSSTRSMHGLGVFCAIAAASWLGGAEAPMKLVDAGFSPVVISLCMIVGVFFARWTVPTLLKGTSFVIYDLRRKPHLMVWAVLAGGIWAVANTLIIVAIRDVGLAIAFPLWNVNSLVGLFWGWLLFGELRGAGTKTWVSVLGGAVAIMVGAVVLSTASAGSGTISSHRAYSGIAAALGAGLLLGTMYIPYRKAYLSGLNPLSFVTIFTVGELVIIGILAFTLHDNNGSTLTQLGAVRSSALWLFLGGFCWVIGDIFQQYGTKYVGISRAIPLSNTNQLWGLVWGALVFGEFVHFSRLSQVVIFSASGVMILGALAISTAAASAGERESCFQAIGRECAMYDMDLEESIAIQNGEEPPANDAHKRRWWDYVILIVALGVFVKFAAYARRPPLAMNFGYATMLIVIMFLFLGAGGLALWKYTRFA